MFLQWMWIVMILCSLLYGLFSGQAAALLPAALDGTASAVSLTLRLAGGYLFFCGMMELVKALGIPKALARLLRPLLHFLMPGLNNPKAYQAVSMNLTANLLGLGNAATPTGMEAVGLMDAENTVAARHAIWMLLILNATSLQLLPTTVLTLRIAAGSEQPNAILLPTLICTGASTLAGVTAGLLCRKTVRLGRNCP